MKLCGVTKLNCMRGDWPQVLSRTNHYPTKHYYKSLLLTQKCSLLGQYPGWTWDNTQVEPGTIPRLNLGQYARWTWENTQAEPGTIPRLNLGQYPGWTWDNTQVEPGTIHRLNLGNIPSIAGKTKLGQFPAIAGKKPCYSRDLSWPYISLL